jgi:hypothetical protein
MFQLIRAELDRLKSQFVISDGLSLAKRRPAVTISFHQGAQFQGAGAEVAAKVANWHRIWSEAGIRRPG